MDSISTYKNKRDTGIEQQIQELDSVFVNPDSDKTTDTSFFTLDSAIVATDSLYNSDQNKIQNEFASTSEKDPDELNMKPRVKDYPGNDWLTGVLFFVFILFVSVKAMYSKYLPSLFQSLINYPTSFRIFREKNYTFFHAAYRLEAQFYIVFSIFIFQVMVRITPGEGLFNPLFFGKTLLGVVVYFLVKKLAYRALGSIFIGVNDTREILFNMDNFNRVAGILLFPVVALITYSPLGNPMITVFLGVLITAVFYLMLLKRSISILLKKQFPIFYLFLYLCTLEFLPLLLIYKIVVD